MHLYGLLSLMECVLGKEPGEYSAFLGLTIYLSHEGPGLVR